MTMINMTEFIHDGVYHITDHYRAIETEALNKEAVDDELAESMRGTKDDVRRQIDELIADAEAKRQAFIKNLNIAFECAYAKMSDIKFKTDDAIDEMEEDRRWAIEELKKYNIYVKE